MTSRTKKLLVATSMVALSVPAHAQDYSDLMQAGEFVDQNYLELANNLLAIYPPISDEAAETYNQLLSDLIAMYESELREADPHDDELEDMVENAKQQEDIVDAKIDVAEKAENEAEKERLEALKDTHEDRRKYLERIRKIREQEVKVYEARIDYYRSLRDAVEKAAELSAERRKANPSAQDILDLEEDLIKLAKKTAELKDEAADASKKLNDERLNAFRERREILQDLNKAAETN